jgi:hypothetical protein
VALKPLALGTWIDPEVIESIVAFGETEEFGKKVSPRVIVHCKRTAPIWAFDTYDKALAFAELLVDRLSK